MRNDAGRHCEEHMAKSGIPDFEKCDEAIRSGFAALDSLASLAMTGRDGRSASDRMGLTDVG